MNALPRDCRRLLRSVERPVVVRLSTLVLAAGALTLLAAIGGFVLFGLLEA